MRTYTIAYLTASSQNLQSLQKQRKDQTNFTIELANPNPDIKNLIEEIISLGAEALVVDYTLSSQNNPITFHGTYVVENILAEKENFPVFVLADNMQEAEEKAHDVHIIYERKSALTQDDKFFQRIKRQIVKYNQQLETKEDRLIQLMSQTKPLTQQQEQEVMALNFSLEKSLDKQSAKTMGALTSTNQDKLKNLLDKVDTVIEEMSK